MADVNQLKRRVARLILDNRIFTINEVTNDGKLMLDSTHEPNKAQNGIGGLMCQLARYRYIAFTGQVADSKAPHRKGGMVRVWQGTDKGREWAKTILDNP